MQPNGLLDAALARIRERANDLPGARRRVLIESLQEFEENFGQMLDEVDQRAGQPLPVGQAPQANEGQYPFSFPSMALFLSRLACHVACFSPLFLGLCFAPPFYCFV